MKHLLKSQRLHVMVLAIVLGAASGVLATAMTNSFLSDYALQLNQETRPLHFDAISPKAFPTSYTEALNHFSEAILPSVVSVFPKSAKTLYGFPENASVATGVIVTSDGWIVTPTFPTLSAEAVVVQINDQIYDVTRVVFDPFTQTTFIKCNANNLSVVGFGSGFNLEIGHQLFVSVRRDQLTLTSVVSQGFEQGSILSSDIPSRRVFIETQTIVSPAPAFDLSGSFVGFVSKKDAQTVLFPFEYLSPSLNALLEKKEIVHATLGISYLDLAHAVGVSETMHRGHGTGAYVTGRPAIRKGSPAARAGILEGDIITAINGQDLNQTRGLNERFLTLRSEEKISLSLDRKGEKKNIEVILGEVKK